MKIRHLLSIAELNSEDILYLVDKSLSIARGELKAVRPLKDRVVGIYFRRTSTRTRTAFAAGTLRSGGQIIQYGPDDLQVVTGETIHDTGQVLSGFLDILVVRTNDSFAEMQALADQDEMAVINAMSENEHPTQAIADLTTVKEALGRLNDVHIMYIGEGNNSALALALAVAKIPGMYLTLLTPEGYGLPASEVARCRSLATEIGSVIDQHHRIDRLPKGVDVVYTTRWQTMGVPKADLNWREKFEPYKVTPELMEKVSKPNGTIFLHDLPAVRGSEVLDEVLDGPQSLAFRQAKHKMNSAMAILSWCIFAD